MKSFLNKFSLCAKCSNSELCRKVNVNEVPERSLFLEHGFKLYCIGYKKNKYRAKVKKEQHKNTILRKGDKNAKTDKQQ